ncbi:MAG: hypothetical protein D6781_10480 [Verrucomicrobia bacterium]|nr:MAG: hypothetical protein D6781_10480 [Verrucomicrobiota bacterium]
MGAQSAATASRTTVAVRRNGRPPSESSASANAAAAAASASARYRLQRSRVCCKTTATSGSAAAAPAVSAGKARLGSIRKAAVIRSAAPSRRLAWSGVVSATSPSRSRRINNAVAVVISARCERAGSSQRHVPGAQSASTRCVAADAGPLSTRGAYTSGSAGTGTITRGRSRSPGRPFPALIRSAASVCQTPAIASIASNTHRPGRLRQPRRPETSAWDEAGTSPPPTET